ncbi:serine/threonine-protein phosphatase [Kineosporia sp. J2-2]|uniref:Serine/threonine-protein phosphatase n=1 Tax=Kineosporia corallincola TaxID=2835133 RepID=A0ABS5TMB9_9ACTN|nr:PP2C family protein-serine/threonine phosphatase [Kineosporia corallincola]MBT0772248.1 serine/threonine-protein phosphatase [Kineosporia corallincola]
MATSNHGSSRLPGPRTPGSEQPRPASASPPAARTADRRVDPGISLRRWIDHGSRPGPRRLWLNATAALVFALVAEYAQNFLPAACVGLFLVLGSAVVRPRHLVRDAALIAVIVLIVLTLTGQQFWSLLPVTMVLLGAVLIGWIQRRERDAAESGLGALHTADAVLLDLRNEMLIRSAGPRLPDGWRFDTDLRPAHGDTFSGDFLVTQQPGPDALEVVLVDVSGNGYRAGARALLLAGAMRALLDAVPASRFLATANHHVVRLGSELLQEGFATAVHVSLDLVGGWFAVTGAGHPPAAHYHAGSGRWEVLDGEQGPALGLIADAAYPATRGRLERGDALMLYTDGLVESRCLDVGRGIDRLVGRADPLIARGVEGAAAHITGAIRTEDGDDRALIIISRG